MAKIIKDRCTNVCKEIKITYESLRATCKKLWNYYNRETLAIPFCSKSFKFIRLLINSQVINYSLKRSECSRQYVKISRMSKEEWFVRSYRQNFNELVTSLQRKVRQSVLSRFRSTQPNWHCWSVLPESRIRSRMDRPLMKYNWFHRTWKSISLQESRKDSS